MAAKVDHSKTRRIRRSFDLTQFQLATALGHSSSWLSLLASGPSTGPTSREES